MLATIQRKRRTNVGTQAAAQRPARRPASGSRGVRTESEIPLSFETFHTELGWMAIAYHDRVLAQLTFGHATPAAAVEHLAVSPGAEPRRSGWPQLVRRLQAYAAGATDDFADVEVDTSELAPFQRRVVERCRRIPYGQTRSYGQLAQLAGSARAARAVGNAMAGNRCPLVIPCHRVVHASGEIGHYSAPAGRRMKLRLLEQEALPRGKSGRKISPRQV